MRSWLFMVAICIGFGSVSAENWPAFRNGGSGTSPEKGLPVTWTADANVVWKTPLTGEGNSSPVVWGDRIFLTASSEDGAQRHVLCVGAADGAILWDKQFIPGVVVKSYPKSGWASPTCATDGERVYAFFDSPGLIALDLDGKVVWQKDLGPFKNTYNMNASPILFGKTLVMWCDQSDQSFTVALDAATGNEKWRTLRQCGPHYATPIVIPHGGGFQIVDNGSPIFGLDAETGKLIWTCRGMRPSVTPSPVFHDGLVYCTSGRNGPTFAIDPGGLGDVTDSRIRMQIATGGPYVPSPIVYPFLFLPGDNGMARFIGPGGDVVVEQRLRGIFTSSPVAADGRIYWTNEKGQTYVIDATKTQADPPAFALVATNDLGERVLATPAIANGRIYIRTAKHLFCIGGEQAVKVAIERTLPAAGLPELKHLYAEHQQPEGEDVALRLDILEAASRIKTPDAIDFIRDIALKDNHWDVEEEAAKVLGSYGPDAIPALLPLLEVPEWREFLRIIAADYLGWFKAVEAVPPLLKMAKAGRPLIRVAALDALAAIAPAHPDVIPDVLPVLIGALDDRESIVRRSAIDGVAVLAGKVGDRRDAVVARLLDLAADPNPLTAAAAKDALLTPFNVPKETVMRDEILYGEQRPEPVAAQIAAGPVRVKFQDGELRYLTVGGTEIVRRIYLAVRDTRWDTVMPAFDAIDVTSTADTFKITLQARCANDIADYSWTGEITGTKEGRITFKVSGQPNTDFRSPRIGFCVLFGADALAGQPYETLAPDAEAAGVPGEFPKLVAQGLLVNMNAARTIRYTRPDGMTVTGSVPDGVFGMEDQRNFGDSSYKLFAGMYPKWEVTKGAKATQTFVLTIENAAPAAHVPPPWKVTLGDVLPGSCVPRSLHDDKPVESKGFMTYNDKRAEFAAAERIVMPYNPAAHMPDEDTFIENVTAIRDQVATIKSFAPKAALRVDPITINSPYLRPGPDPRNDSHFAVAWTARLMKYMAIAGVQEAVFGLGPKSAAMADEIAKYAGKPVVATKIENTGHAQVDALAVADGDKRIVWLINLTDQPQRVVVGEGKGVEVELSAFEVKKVE